MNRIQRKRTKGFKLPSNTLCVTRPNKWSNPFKIDKDCTLEESLFKYRIWIENLIRIYPDEYNLDELRKYNNIACWCNLHKKCHTDILIELLNSK